MFSNSVFDDLEIAKQISAILLNKKKPLSLEQIRTELKHKAIDNEMLTILFSKYQKHFQLFEQPLVKLVTKVGICKAHCTKGTDCSGISPCCSGLHICKFHFLSGKCEWGRECTYGHDLNLDHNKKILRDNLLDNISVDDLKYLLGLAINRTTLTIPRICKFYNVENDKCRHTKAGSACSDLHICKYYVSNTCQYDERCQRNHNVKDETNKNILSKHGIDTSKPESEIIQELRNVLSAKQEECSSTRIDNSTTTSTSSTIPSMASLKKETAITCTLETTTDQVPKPFRRLYSRVSMEDQWGNFIDTAGYEESALMWKAQGEALHSVCMICFPGGSGTGFRVGMQRSYVMTAGHVYDFMLRLGRDGVGKQKHNPLTDRDSYAVFGYLKEGEYTEHNKFYFKDKIVFRNNETDCVILELEEHSHGMPMPPALTNFQKADFAQPFFFVGHSEGKPLRINRVDKMVNIQSAEAQTDISNVRRMSLEYTKCEEYPNGREYEVQPHQILQSPHRFLFHCKFTKGASGSPGMVFQNDGRIVVVSMLLCGYPNWYYDPDQFMDIFRTNWAKDSWCVEQGVNLQSVHDFMNKTNPELAKEIFSF